MLVRCSSIAPHTASMKPSSSRSNPAGSAAASPGPLLRHQHELAAEPRVRAAVAQRSMPAVAAHAPTERRLLLPWGVTDRHHRPPHQVEQSAVQPRRLPVRTPSSPFGRPEMPASTDTSRPRWSAESSWGRAALCTDRRPPAPSTASPRAVRRPAVGVPRCAQRWCSACRAGSGPAAAWRSRTSFR